MSQHEDDGLGRFLRDNRPRPAEAKAGEAERIWRRIEAEERPAPGHFQRIAMPFAAAAGILISFTLLQSGTGTAPEAFVAEDAAVVESLDLEFIGNGEESDVSDFLALAE